MEKENNFLCPECGGDKAYSVMEVSTVYDPDDPISGILEWISCEQCQNDIPAHIAERWNGLTTEQARQEWQDVYRTKSKR
ncbi:MAG: hypothetical protein PSN44_05970 [Gammaproteobacteria bacterium]|nr:hypothetical protein [Gammaproteobacteria bacterium]